VLKAKAVLCPGLCVSFEDKASGEKVEWHYEDGLRSTWWMRSANLLRCPMSPSAAASGNKEAVDWALLWLPEGGDAVQESYVNLIPTPQGGTHVNGLRQGLLDAMREFCEFRNLLPRGVKLAPEDVWERITFVLSMKMQDAQFSGQTKERLSSREAAGLCLRRGQGCLQPVAQCPPWKWASSLPSWRSATPTAASRPARKLSASASPKGQRCRASWPTAPGRPDALRAVFGRG
jgi:DNA gyrase/topoisomerase IV subunit B